jgi:hypothetical protein
VISPSPSASPNPSPIGVFIPTFHSPIASDPLLQQALRSPYVDGFFISRHWRDVQPTAASFAWDSLDADLRAVAAAGKKASLGVGAGIFSPSWLCASSSAGGAGAQCLDLVIKPFTFSGDASCNNESLPVPWNSVFLDNFGRMVAALGQHLASQPQLASVIVDVKITGINDRDEETILPSARGGTVPCTSGNACQSGQCPRSDALGALEGAGYNDQNARQAYLRLAQAFRSAFPGTPIGSQVSSALPSPESDSLPLTLVQALVGTTSAFPITVQDNGLAATTGVDTGTLYARAAGVPVGYQMLFVVSGDPTCAMGRGLGPGGRTVPCDESVLRAAIDNGINNGGARFLEIYKEDVSAYPNAIADAHNRLLSQH